jgi:hypothetical protein
MDHWLVLDLNLVEKENLLYSYVVEMVNLLNEMVEVVEVAKIVEEV